MDYEDFTLLVAHGRRGPEVRVLGSPAGEDARAPFDSDLSGHDLTRLARIFERASNAPPGAVRRHLRPTADAGDRRFVEEVGERLFRSLVSGEVRERLVQSLERAPRGLRIRLQLDLSRTGADTVADGAPGLHRLPWELLRWPDGGRPPMALSRRTPVIRHLEVEGAVGPPPAGPVGVLVVAPEPRDAPPLALAREIEALRRELSGGRDVHLRVLDPPTLEGLIDALRGGDVQVLHFMGHGELEPPGIEGALVLEDPSGRSRRLGAHDLMEQLGDFLAPLRLVFLNACRTAEAADGAPWAGVATALVKAGVPAVIAMQFPVTDRGAVTFAGAVYERLAAGAPVEEAVTEGRLAIRRDHPGSPEWATPALFLRVPGGRLFSAPKRGRRSIRSRAGGLVGALAAALFGLAVGGWLLVPGLVPKPEGAPEGVPEGAPPVEARALPAEEEAGAAGPSRSPSRGTLPEATAARPAGEDRSPEPGVAGGGATGGGPGGPSVPAVHELATGETRYLPEAGAHVTAELVTLLGKEMIRVTLSPDGRATRVQSGFPGNVLRFGAGEESLPVELVSADREAGAVRLRVRRTAAW